MPITKLEKYYEFGTRSRNQYWVNPGTSYAVIDGVERNFGKFLWENSAWDPLPSVYLEVVAKRQYTTPAGYIALWNVTDGAMVAGSEITVSGATKTRYRIGPFSMPTNDLKEFKIYAKVPSNGWMQIYSCRLIFVQSGAIKKTVTYIPLLKGDTRGRQDTYVDAAYPVFFKYESGLFDNVEGIFFEASLSSAETTSTVWAQLHDGSAAVSGSEISGLSYSDCLRVRSAALTLTDALEYKVQVKQSGSNELYNDRNVIGGQIVVKQNGAAIAKSASYPSFHVDYDSEAATTYGEGTYEGIYYWDPNNWDSLADVFYEMTVKTGLASYAWFRKLRNRTNNLDIVNGELTGANTAYARYRTVDFLNDMPASAKEMGEYDKHAAGGYSTNNQRLIIVQASASVSTDFLRGYFKANAYAKDFLRGYFAAALPIGTDFLRGFFAGKGQWDKQFLRAFFASNKEGREFLRGYFRTLHESTDKLRGYFATRDTEGPYIKGEVQLVVGSQALNPGALGVSKDAKIRFRVADDGWGADHSNSGWWCKRREFFRNAAQAEVNLVETTYDKNSAGVVVTATQPLDREHQFDITPASPFTEGKEVQIIVFSGRDKAGNPGTGKKA